MPLQNRVLATGEIIAHPARGLFMGNRGILHDKDRRLTNALWRHKAWIICALKWKDWHRDVMRPDNYTELFFLDEAVAMAAGHRPCALCRRPAFNEFRAAADLNGPARDMDDMLHGERAIPRRFQQRRHQARIEALPSGAVILDGVPKLVLRDALRPVSLEGYGPAEPRPTGQAIVLTPETSLAALHGGYRPRLHPSAG